MAFTFQINNSVHFNHDQRLLDKAAALKPKLNKKIIFPQALVKIVDDQQKLAGIGIKKVDDIANITQYRLKRNDKLILDFGNHYVGYFSIKLCHHGSPQDAPLTLKLKFAEVPAEFSYQVNTYDGWLSKSWIQEEVIHIDHLPFELKMPRRYAFRYIELDVIDTSPKWSVSFSDPRVQAVSSAEDSRLTKEQLNDPELQRIYDVSVKTLHDCMQMVFEDGPKRDRRLWLGDLHLQALVNYVSYHNTNLVKRCLYLFGGLTTTDGRIVADVFTNNDPIPDDTFLFDYSLFFISTLDDYFNETQDHEALDDLYPVAKKQMGIASQYIDNQGALHQDNDYPVFVDWSNEFDKQTAGQAEMIYALRQFIHLAKVQDDNSAVSQYKILLKQMIDYSLQQLYDSDHRLFVSGNKRECNIASQVWMVLAGVVTGHDAQSLLQQTVKKLFPVRGIATPYMYHYIVAAFFKAGLTQEAITQLKNYWGKMIRLGADTYWEAFEPEKPDYSPYGSPVVSSYCHAWGCTPAFLIDKYVTKRGK